MNIAIVGGGISGISAGWELAKHHNVTIFESNSKIDSISSSKKSILIGFDLSFGKISNIDPLTENSDLSRTKDVL